MRRLFLVFMSFCFVLCGCVSDELKSARAEFDLEVERIRKEEDCLRKELHEAEEFLKVCGTPLFESVRDDLRSVIKEGYSSIVVVPERPGELSDIVRVTEKELVSIGYVDVCERVKKAVLDLKVSEEQFRLLSNPSAEFVAERLYKVSHVSGVEMADEENDPYGRLNKAGSYTGLVYFSSDLVDESVLSGGSIIDVGTDCGGCIEIFSSVEDAKRRDDYLSAFDGTIFAPGLHSVVGTLVVRVSERLSASVQSEFEEDIVKGLARLD